MSEFTDGVMAITASIIVLTLFFWIGGAIKSTAVRMFGKRVIPKPIENGALLKVITKNGIIYEKVKYRGTVEGNKDLPFSFYGMVALEKEDGKSVYVKHEFIRIMECV